MAQGRFDCVEVETHRMEVDTPCLEVETHRVDAESRCVEAETPCMEVVAEKTCISPCAHEAEAKPACKDPQDIVGAYWLYFLLLFVPSCRLPSLACVSQHV